MKTKINFFTIDIFEQHYYEFSTFIKLDKIKPLTKLIKKQSDLLIKNSLIDKQYRNIITYSKPISNNVFKNDNIIKFYCTTLN